MKIKLNESKILEFKMDTSGCSWEDLKGYLRFTFEGIEYGFPAEFKDGMATVQIPPLKEVVNNTITESISKNKEIAMKGRLDVIANNNAYIMPWKGDIEIEVPISVKVENIEDKEKLLEALDGALKVDEIDLRKSRMKHAGKDAIETPDFTVALYTGKKYKGMKVYKDDVNKWYVDKKGIIHLMDEAISPSKKKSRFSEAMEK